MNTLLAVYLFAAVAGTAYAIQNALILQESRRFSALSVALVRSIGLSLLMLPLLYTATAPIMADLQGLGWWVLVPIILNPLSFPLFLQASRYLPVGIVGSAIQLQPIMVFVWEWLIFGRQLSTEVLLILMAVTLLSTMLSLTEVRDMQQIDSRNASRGYILLAINIIVGSFAMIGFNQMIMGMSTPYVAAYFWEALSMVGFVMMVIIWRVFAQQSAPTPITTVRDWGRIWLKSSLAAVGTIAVSLAFAATYAVGASLAIPSVVLLVTTTFVVIVAGWLLYRDRLSAPQLLLIVLLVALLTLLYLVVNNTITLDFSNRLGIG